MLEREKIEIPVKPAKDEDLIASLRALREKIKAQRGGKLIAVDVIEKMREERDNELLGLR